MSDTQNRFKFDAINIAMYFWNRRLPIIIVAVVTVIASAIISLILPEKYKSEITLFPLHAGSISQDLVTSSPLITKAVLRLGVDEEIDQLMQVLKSKEIFDKIVSKYDLLNHYEIKEDSKNPYTQLYNQYNKNVTIMPTRYFSVSILVLDTDPIVAANMANDIAAFADSAMNNMQRSRAQQIYNLVESECIALQKEILTKEDSLNTLRRKGVVDNEKLSDALCNAIINGNNKAASDIKKYLEQTDESSGNFTELSSQLKTDREYLSFLKTKLTEARVDLNQRLPQSFVINKAVPAESRAYPVRWLIVVTSTITTIIAFILFMVLFDALKKHIKYLNKE